MPSTPTTKSQVHAYQFVIRRMESALVRKDAVMLHEPTRTQTRATVVGAILAAVCCLGFIVWGYLDPTGKAPPENGIVISKQSGAVYVAMNNPTKMLVATPNLASARLLLVAMGGSAGQATAPVTVDEASLTGVSRGAFTGIPGAPELLPTGEQIVSPDWGVCDQLTVDQAQVKGEEKPAIDTTAFGGVTNLGRKLKDEEGLLFKAPNGSHYLVFASDPAKGLPGAGAVRAKIDMGNKALMNAMRISNPVPRLASSALINSIPEVKELKPLEISDKGSSITAYPAPSGRKVGEVVREQRADGSFGYYLLLKDGVQEIPLAVADLMQTASGSSSAWVTLGPGAVSNLQRSNTAIDMKDYPRVVPKIVGVLEQGTTCLNWGVQGGKPVTWVGLANATPTPDPKLKPVELAQADGSGDKVDKFFMPPGKAAVVRSTTSENNFGSGPIFLVSDRGVRFGIPNQKVAEGLGLGADYRPAPEVILRTLPTGPILDPKEAARIFDTVQVDETDPKRRVMPSQNAQPGG
ncbi:type VII secretion protein EccB [Crossiella sp. SN42]|uniref:type VII secretion protein EccB n=1 Tax=Crossiella sp. SN42 TaxID=2944808 RepID=UPI00211245FA|nr:type VII secretion protein EccB [Crossiella sp. SN42]